MSLTQITAPIFPRTWVCPEQGSQVPYVGVCSGLWSSTHMASGGNCISTYAFSPGEPHSSVQVLQLHCLLCSSTPHHHCPPRSGWSGAAHSSGCCTVCRTACRHTTDCQDNREQRKGIAFEYADCWCHYKWQSALPLIFNPQAQGKVLKRLSSALRFRFSLDHEDTECH